MRRADDGGRIQRHASALEERTYRCSKCRFAENLLVKVMQRMSKSNKGVEGTAFVRTGVSVRGPWQRRLIAAGLATGLAFPVLAQDVPRIAGTYRGLMTQCLLVPRLEECIKGLTDISELADDVDLKRGAWETAGRGSDSALTAGRQRDYAAALDTLNLRIADFNRDMKRPPAVSN